MPIVSTSGATEATTGEELDRHIQATASVLAQLTRITIVCHENPDADTLGGGLALARALESVGASPEIVCATSWPTTLDFLPGIDRILPSPHQDPESIVLVDCASIERAGSSVAAWIATSDATIVNVDHHLSNAGYGSFACIDHSAAATSQIIARLIGALGVALEPVTSSLLLAGVLHDTDGLRAEGTGPATLRLVADLVEGGGDVAEISQQLFGQRPLTALRLWGEVLVDLEAHLNARVVIGTLSADRLHASGARLLDAEDLPDMIATARGAEIALLLREVGSAEVRVSIRTAPSVNAAAIAKDFGGGGHERAGGCTLPLPLDDARLALLEACRLRLSPSGDRS